MITHDHGSTAIAGITYYAADHFPPEYRDNIFIGNVVTNRINRDRLERHGLTPQGDRMPDFLKCDDPWFRPVDIKLGPDGALYVADFYNRIIGHYEVPLNHPGRDRERGRIWRIVYTGPDGKNTAAAPRSDWTNASVAELVEDLGNPNLTVRLKATNQLVERGKSNVEALRARALPLRSRRRRVSRRTAHLLWVFQRLGELDEKTLLEHCGDSRMLVRLHAFRILGERVRWSDAEHKTALAGLADADANVQRAAADALGRHPSPRNLNPLIELRFRCRPPTRTCCTSCGWHCAISCDWLTGRRVSWTCRDATPARWSTWLSACPRPPPPRFWCAISR